jgi:hypothetical protein
VGFTPAADRTAQRFQRIADGAGSWDSAVGRRARDTAATRLYYRRFNEAYPLGAPSPAYLLRQNVMLEEYGRVEQDVQQLLIHARR